MAATTNSTLVTLEEEATVGMLGVGRERRIEAMVSHMDVQAPAQPASSDGGRCRGGSI